MILAICALLSLQLHAEDTRDQVRNEILKSFDEANQARQTTINELEKTVKNIKSNEQKKYPKLKINKEKRHKYIKTYKNSKRL